MNIIYPTYCHVIPASMRGFGCPHEGGHDNNSKNPKRTEFSAFFPTKSRFYTFAVIPRLVRGILSSILALMKKIPLQFAVANSGDDNHLKILSNLIKISIFNGLKGQMLINLINIPKMVREWV